MDTDTKDIGIKMINKKESEYPYLQVAISKQENIILIYYIDALRLNFQMVTVIGGNIRMVREMDMERLSGLMEANKLGNTSRLTVTGTEFTGGQMEECIKQNTNRVKAMVMGIIGMKMAMNITDNSRMT
jgi:hypothetical protein